VHNLEYCLPGYSARLKELLRLLHLLLLLRAHLLLGGRRITARLLNLLHLRLHLLHELLGLLHVLLVRELQARHRYQGLGLEACTDYFSTEAYQVAGISCDLGLDTL
jgi:hypothetical protein